MKCRLDPRAEVEHLTPRALFTFWEWMAWPNLNLNLKYQPSQGQVARLLWYMNVYANEVAIKQGSFKNLPQQISGKCTAINSCCILIKHL